MCRPPCSSAVYSAISYFNIQRIHTWLCLPNGSTALQQVQNTPDSCSGAACDDQTPICPFPRSFVFSQTGMALYNFCQKSGQVTLYASSHTAEQWYLSQRVPIFTLLTLDFYLSPYFFFFQFVLKSHFRVNI